MVSIRKWSLWSIDEDEAARLNMTTSSGALEETIHQELREYNYKNYLDTGSKEWFVLTKEKLNEIVNKYDFSEVI